MQTDYEVKYSYPKLFLNTGRSYLNQRFFDVKFNDDESLIKFITSKLPPFSTILEIRKIINDSELVEKCNKTANKREIEIINDMCYTFRHDYGIMVVEEREYFFNEMKSIYEKCIKPTHKLL